MSRNLFIAALALGFAAVSSQAATITHTATYDNSMPGVVGNAFFTYEAPAILANGNYSWSSFVNPGVYIVFSNGSVFTHADFAATTTTLGVEISSGQFNFTTLDGTPMVSDFGGSADFVNADGNILSHSPNDPGQSYNFGPNSIYAAYYMDLSAGNSFYAGAYGIGSNAATISAPPIPEPSTYGLILGGLALAGAAIRRRKSAK